MMFSFAFLLLLAAVIVCVILAVGAFRGQPPTGPSEFLVCGKCQYPARGISTFHCPECGADLREVGIVPPGHRGVPTWLRATLVLMWTWVIIAFGSGISKKVIGDWIPNVSYSTFKIQCTVPSNTFDFMEVEARVVNQPGFARYGTTSTAGSAGAFIGHVSIDAIAPANTPELLVIRLRPTSASTMLTMAVDPKTLQYWRYDAAGKEIDKQSGFNAAVMEAWLHGKGSEANQTFDKEIQELAFAVNELARGNGAITLTTLHPLTLTSALSSTRPAWPGLVLAGLWLTVYLAGLWWLLRRWKRPADTGTSAPA